MSEVVDLIIIGGGPAGLTAGIYAARGALNTLLIEKFCPGGQIALTETLENYPGFAEISGVELTRLMEDQAKKFGLAIVNEEVVQVLNNGKAKLVKTGDASYKAKSVIVASGTQAKRLGLEGEEKLIGKGVSYCATCDGRFFQNKDVCVVGGGDAAIKEALYLSKLVRKIYVVHRRTKLRAEKIIQKKAMSNPKFEFLWDSVVDKFIGQDKLEGVIVKDLNSSRSRELAVDGVFIYVGNNPNTDFIDVRKDDNKFIVTNENLETSMRGVFAAGDCRSKPFRQVATAVGDGALAAFLAERYVEELKDG
ncbi:MAG: thioredoxin-disulfide reductase [Promethearchaeati archaeon SRVP18_Atabeyarchaeia-1]